MLLMKERLVKTFPEWAGEKRELKMTVSPTMSMKTKEDGTDKSASPTMLMKTSNLIFIGHDVHDK